MIIKLDILILVNIEGYLCIDQEKNKNGFIYQSFIFLSCLIGFLKKVELEVIVKSFEQVSFKKYFNKVFLIGYFYK